MSSGSGAISEAPGTDSAYSWFRLAAALLISTVGSAGLWSVVVVLPIVQAEFGSQRSGASLPYTMVMLGVAFGTIAMGRLADRFTVALPLALAAVMIGIGYVIAGYAPNLTVFALAHLLIGLGTSAGFAPLMADISHWFVKRRGLAVVVAASGNYIAGTIWPLLINHFLPSAGWRSIHIVIGVIIFCVLLPLAPIFRRQVSRQTIAAAETATAAARADLGMSPLMLQILLTVAGFACCVAMAMPQVHIVAYCGDLGYGVAHGAEMLSLMLGLGVVSRIASGFVADRIGAGLTLVLGSAMQMLSLTLYLVFNGLESLFVISAIFGLFQGGIVPMYAVLIRDYLPPREAGVRIGFVISATILGMAFGGYFSGLIYDVFHSYRMAFLNGVLWNVLNLMIVLWLLLRRRQAVAAAA